MFNFNAETKPCPQCGYKIISPFPQHCPRCDAILERVGMLITSPTFPANSNPHEKPFLDFGSDVNKPQGGDTPVTPERDPTLVKAGKNQEVGLEGNELDDGRKIFKPRANPEILSPDGDYLKMMGVINVQTREIIFCSQESYSYVLELGANAHDIATSILGGTLERVLLEPAKNKELALRHVETGEREAPVTLEEAVFQVQGNMLLCIYGLFYKRPILLLQEFKRLLIDHFKGKIKESITDMERNELDRRKGSMVGYVIHQYKKIQETAGRKTSIPTMEQLVTLHYVGLSYQSIGTLSLLLTPEGDEALPIDGMAVGSGADAGVQLELVESLVSAKIEAIAANTLANTGSFPRYIITKTGFDAYRVIEFVELENDYCLQLLASGNVEILEALLQSIIMPRVKEITQHPFTGMLTRHNELKAKLRETLGSAHVFTLEK